MVKGISTKQQENATIHNSVSYHVIKKPEPKQKLIKEEESSEKYLDKDSQVLVNAEETIERLKKYLHDIKELSGNIDEKTKFVVTRRSVQVVAELEDLRDCLEGTFEQRMSLSQKGWEGTYTSHADPSIQFFGIEWRGLFETCCRLENNIKTVQRQCGPENREDGHLNLFSVILDDVNRIEVEVEHHTVAVLRGNLSKENLAAQRELQNKHREIGRRTSIYKTRPAKLNR